MDDPLGSPCLKCYN